MWPLSELSSPTSGTFVGSALRMLGLLGFATSIR
jgi:hypothetical protein